MAAKPSDVERIKAGSRHLRGTLAESLQDPLTGALRAADTHISKFHGFYQQDDRDRRSERKRQRLEPDYSFMIRVRTPAGICTSEQWLALDTIAKQYGNESIRLTTRQAVQFHGIIKGSLKPSIQAINAALLDTISACGDVNRNVMAPALMPLSAVHGRVQEHAQALSAHLTPATGAYHEIWLDGEKLTPADDEVEPIYGDSYLPRKFKAAFAVPPQNDVDIFSQDLGFIAIIERGSLLGFNVTAGGGMGMSHGETETCPALANVLGFCQPQQVLAVAEAIVTTQRDFGDRSNRKHARLKYTIADRGLDWFRQEVERRAGLVFGEQRPYAFSANGDVYGWQKDDRDRWHYTLFVENGRIADSAERAMLSGLRTVANTHAGGFILTPNQNLIISNVAAADREPMDALLDRLQLKNEAHATALRRNSLACVALPSCALAMAESERYLPELVTRLEAELAGFKLQDVPITIRMTGCPNGCARPYIAEIGLVGKGPGRYKLYLGAGFAGQRLGQLYRDNADEEEIVAALRPLFRRYSEDRRADEHFGDFLVRSGTVNAVQNGADIHG